MKDFWNRAAHKSTSHSTLTDVDNEFFNHATPEMKSRSNSLWRGSPSASPLSLSPERWLQLQPRMSLERKRRLEAIDKQRAQIVTGDVAGQELVSETVVKEAQSTIKRMLAMKQSIWAQLSRSRSRSNRSPTTPITVHSLPPSSKSSRSPATPITAPQASSPQSPGLPPKVPPLNLAGLTPSKSSNADEPPEEEQKEWKKGDRLIYKRTGETVRILKVHIEDPPPYYTVLFVKDRHEKQTTGKHMEEGDVEDSPRIEHPKPSRPSSPSPFGGPSSSPSNSSPFGSSDPALDDPFEVGRNPFGRTPLSVSPPPNRPSRPLPNKPAQESHNPFNPFGAEESASSPNPFL